MSISSLLYTARDSLITHQLAIDVTGSNIANVDTPGYTQQRPEFKAVGSINIDINSAQVGVDIERISRIYDRYIEAQLIEQQQNGGYSETMLQGLQNIEVIVDDTNGGGLNEALNNFWAAWESLSQNPGDEIQRSSLYSVSENLINTVTYYYQNLTDLKKEWNDSISAIVSQINDQIREITDLNSRLINAGENRGDNNTLLDKRAEALRQLSTLVDINYFENNDGTINVYLSNGQPLLQGYVGRYLTTDIGTDGLMDIISPALNNVVLNDAMTRGKLGAVLELQKSTVPQYLDYLDQFSLKIAERVNELHAAGYDSYQNTGADFFVISDLANPAALIKISDAITEDKNRIAASRSVNGDGENASQIASIQKELIMSGNTSTLNGFVSSMVGKIGHQVSAAKTYDDHQTIVSCHLTERRDSISGVSIDEEMIRLIKFQMGYTAAANLCSTVNELMDELMAIVKG